MGKKNKRNKNKKGKKMTDVQTPLTQAEIQKLIDEHNKGGAFKQVVSQSCWDSGIEILKSCGHMTIPRFHVMFEPLADQKIKKLQSYYTSLEWLMYLEGEIDYEKNTVLVKDLVLPDSQKVTGVNVNDVEYTWDAGRAIIGVIHSHHNMGAFFSGTDDAYINQNHDVSIVVATNPSSPIKGQVRVKTPCNAYVLSENCTFSVKYPSVLDEEAFEKEFTAKIHTYQPAVVTYPISYIGNGLGNFSRGYSRGNGYYHRGMSNPVRHNQNIPSSNQLNLLGYDTQEELNGFPDPFKMGEKELREHLADYYTEAEIQEFAENDELAEELNIIQELCAEGYNVQKGFPDGEHWNESWNTLGDEDDESDLDCNMGMDTTQVSRGVALRDQIEGEKGVWCMEDEEVEYEFDDDEIVQKEVVHGKNGVVVVDNSWSTKH